jgi:ribosome-associated protein
LELALKTIDAVKGLDPIALDVRGLCSFADYFLITSGTSRRHVLALAEHLEEALSKAGVKPLGVEGLQDGLWVLMDFNDVVIHIFSQPLREFYNLEGLWAEAPRLNMGTETAVTSGTGSIKKPVQKPETKSGTGHD